jgi:hypothetical protein
MKIQEIDNLKILTPESDEHILYNIKTNSYFQKVFLGVNDSVDNYRDISKAELENNNKTVKDAIDELMARNDELDILIIELAAQLAILQLTKE